MLPSPIHDTRGFKSSSGERVKPETSTLFCAADFPADP